jgi:hypothetical protein
MRDLVYVTQGAAWESAFASWEGAEASLDDYLTRCHLNAQVLVEDGTDERGWFKFGEYPAHPTWHRYFREDGSDQVHEQRIAEWPVKP